MPDKTYQAIANALDLLGNGMPAQTNGKITAVNVAAEAGVCKATLYRYFTAHEQLKNDYSSLRRRGIRLHDEPPMTLQQAYTDAQAEIRSLKKQVAEAKKDGEQLNKLKSHQILLLWAEVDQLRNDVKRMVTQLEMGKVTHLPTPKR